MPPKPRRRERRFRPPRLLTKPGAPLPDGWRERYLVRVRQHGGLELAAEEVGVHPDTARNYRAADPEFASEVTAAREVHTDTLVQRLIATSDDKANGDPGNPVGLIVTLKSRRPAEFIERTATLTATVDVNALEPNAGLALIEAILGEMRPAARARLAATSTADS